MCDRHFTLKFLFYLYCIKIFYVRDVMGLINVRLNLLDDTILFLSREAFRLACIGHRGKVSIPVKSILRWNCQNIHRVK